MYMGLYHVHGAIPSVLTLKCHCIQWGLLPSQCLRIKMMESYTGAGETHFPYESFTNLLNPRNAYNT